MVNLGLLYARFVQFGPKLVLVIIAIGTEINILCFFFGSGY